MNNPTDKLEVTEADEIAAASVWEPDPTTLEAVVYDNALLARAFARHRLSIERETLERAAKVVDQMADDWFDKERSYRAAGNNGPYLGAPSYRAAAAAIRGLQP